MLTKQQKIEQVKEAKQMVSDSKAIVFVDFSSTSDEELKKLRQTLRTAGAKLKVFKKKLMRIVMQESGYDFNPEQFETQVGTIFSPLEIFEIAGSVYKFHKSIKNDKFKILGGYDLLTKNPLEAALINRIGQLPSREILLAQLVGMMSAPMKMFLYVLDQKSKQTVEK